MQMLCHREKGGLLPRCLLLESASSAKAHSLWSYRNEVILSNITIHTQGHISELRKLVRNSLFGRVFDLNAQSSAPLFPHRRKVIAEKYYLALKLMHRNDQSFPSILQSCQPECSEIVHFVSRWKIPSTLTSSNCLGHSFFLSATFSRV